MKHHDSIHSNTRLNELTGIKFLKVPEQLESEVYERYVIDSEAVKNYANVEKCVLIRFGSNHYSVDHDDIAYVFKGENLNVLVTKSGTRFPIFVSLWELYIVLNNKRFNQISSNLLVNRGAIKSIHPDTNNRMIINLEPDSGQKFYFPNPGQRIAEVWTNGRHDYTSKIN